MYTLEVYSSIVWGGIIRCRESQSHVLYPSEADDEFFSDSTSFNVHIGQISFPGPGIRNSTSWLHGWNFTTDLYRILEYAMNDFHRRKPQSAGPFSPGELFGREAPPPNMVLDRVMALHENLPPIFKRTAWAADARETSSQDRVSFQAANIVATLQVI